MKRSSQSWFQKRSAIISCFVLIFIAVLFGGCKKEMQSDQSIDLLKSGTSKKGGAHIVVSPGNSIQAAINIAKPGSVILIQPGIYKESLIIDQPDITLKGLSHGDAQVILENPDNQNNGISVRSNGDGFQLYNITIQGFKRNGVFIIRADNFILSHVTAINCGEYGIYPLFCKRGRVEHCSATGHDDTGIYIGQSEEIELSFNTVYGNVNGLEIENCSKILASFNQCYDNVAGILVVLLPGLTVKTSSDILLLKNHVYNNNHVNFADPNGGFEAVVPTGSGILVVGTDNTFVIDNNIEDNNFLGIAVVSTTLIGALANLPPEAFADIEPNPDGAKVKYNKLKRNGFSPPPLPIPLPGADLLWDGSGTGNCWSSNKYQTSYPQSLPSCN